MECKYFCPLTQRMSLRDIFPPVFMCLYIKGMYDSGGKGEESGHLGRQYLAQGRLSTVSRGYI